MSTLKIGSDIVGIPWKVVKKQIHWRDTTNYAASLNDMNPHYIDDERPGGIVASPMFAVTLGWPLAQKIHEQVEMPYPQEVFDQTVHYTAYIDYERLIRPGETVTVFPTICTVAPRKSGTYLVYKFVVTDEDGKLIHTEYMGVMLRGVACLDAGKGEESTPSTKPLKAETVLWESSIPVSRAFPYVYDGCTGIVFDIHTSPKFAHSVGLPDILVQGTTTVAFGVRELINKEAGGDPGRVKALGGRLTAMVFPDTEIKVQLLEKHVTPEGTDLHFQVVNQEGQVALSHGYVKLVNN